MLTIAATYTDCAPGRRIARYFEGILETVWHILEVVFSVFRVFYSARNWA